MKRLDEMPEVLNPAEVAQVMRLSLNSLYASIRRGQIPSVRIGRRLLVPKAALIELLRQAGDEQNQDSSNMGG